LRKKIEKGPIRIATVRGLGYCLEKIHTAADTAPPAPLKPLSTPPTLFCLANTSRLDAHAFFAVVASHLWL
jgi:hypothetical protein